MIKNIIFLIVFILLLVFAGGLFLMAPYHIYTLTLTEGVSTRFLEMQPSPKVFYDGQDHFDKLSFERVADDDALFSDFHFSNFLMPLPFNHAIYSMVPVIKLESKAPRLGAIFLNGKSEEIFSFMIEKNYKLETFSSNQSLFSLPVFRNHISRKSEEEIWRDLFLKKLSLPSNEGQSFFSSLSTLKNLGYNDLVYNLYILYNRNHFFPPETTKLSFDAKSKHGLIELRSSDPNYKLERLYIIENGIVYSLTIRTKLNNFASANFREKMLERLTYKSSSVDSAIPIYAEYKNIAYTKRVDQQGMIYLYCAWSHDISNRDYVRVIILFLERGKLNLKFLKPFYEYAFKRFGTNLSSEEEVLLETADEKLKRRMKDELDSEVKKEDQQKNPTFEGNFTTPEEKIKYYLNKAKANKINSDDSNKELLEN